MDTLTFYDGPLGKNSIVKDHNICGPSKVYGDSGHGQGCDTVWFSTVVKAREVIKGLGRVPSGYDVGLCANCKNNFRFGSEEWEKAVEYACKEYKARVSGRSQD